MFKLFNYFMKHCYTKLRDICDQYNWLPTYLVHVSVVQVFYKSIVVYNKLSLAEPQGWEFYEII